MKEKFGAGLVLACLVALSPNAKAAPISTPELRAQIQSAGSEIDRRFGWFMELIRPYEIPENGFFMELFGTTQQTLSNWKILQDQMAADSPDYFQVGMSCDILTGTLDAWKDVFDYGEPWLNKDANPDFQAIGQTGAWARASMDAMKAACALVPKTGNASAEK